MSKPVPIRIRTGAKPGWDGRGNAWRIIGDLNNRTETCTWGGWRNYSCVSHVIIKAIKSNRPLIISSGKKEKKFWGKVQRRIERYDQR